MRRCHVFELLLDDNTDPEYQACGQLVGIPVDYSFCSFAFLEIYKENHYIFGFDQKGKTKIFFWPKKASPFSCNKIIK